MFTAVSFIMTKIVKSNLNNSKIFKLIYQFMVILKYDHLKLTEIFKCVSSSFGHVEQHPNFVKKYVYA